METTTDTGASVEATTDTTTEASDATTDVAADTTTAATTDAATDQPTSEAFTLEDLLGADLGDDPIMQGEHKGLPHYNEILKHLPENGRKLIQNFRSSLTRKQQEYAALNKQLTEERADLQRQRALLSNSPAAQAIAAQAEKGLAEGVDPWSEEGLNALIEQKAAQMMQKVLAPMQEEVVVAQRRAQLEQFKTAHPDLTNDSDVKAGVVELLKTNPEMKLETAYWAVRGKRDASAQQRAREEKQQARTDHRSALLKTSTGQRVVNGVRQPKFKSAWDAYQWHQQNKG